MTSGLCAALLALAIFGGHFLPHRVLAFISVRDDNLEIYLLDVDRGLLRNLTQHPATDALPTWSPDGTLLSFASTRYRVYAGDYRLYLMNPLTRDLRRLDMHYELSELTHAWSPDGRWIAFASGVRSEQREIYVLETACVNLPDGCDDHVLRLTNNLVDDSNPTWSPDGKWLAFVSFRDSTPERPAVDVYTLDTTCIERPETCERSIRRITYMNSSMPAWSPDGRRLAFVALGSEERNLEIFVIEVAEVLVDEGGCLEPQGCAATIRRLTFNAGRDERPIWSQDGRYIAFTSNRAGNFDIYMMDSDCDTLPGGCDAHLRRLTDDPALDYGPAWMP